MLIVELLFKWLVISNVESYTSYNHWTAEQLAALMMLLSHWIWLCTATTAQVCKRSSFNSKRTKALASSNNLDSSHDGPKLRTIAP